MLFPQVFSNLNAAQTFVDRFLNHLPDIRIISLGLPEQYKVDFLEDIAAFSSKNPEPYGVEKWYHNISVLTRTVPKKSGTKC